jgi:hypothetical protein
MNWHIGLLLCKLFFNTSYIIHISFIFFEFMEWFVSTCSFKIVISYVL